jgi:DNA-binding transcriptional ArsR family regulator
MPDQEPRSIQRLTDPRALRALAHPIRLSLLSLLRTEGPLTATRAGELIGESSASCSFHLRQLAKYGLVEEAGGGTGRQRPWRAVAMFTDVPVTAEDPDFAAASGRFWSVVVGRYFDQLMRWLEASPAEPPQWREAAQFGDTMVYLSAAELAELGEQLTALVDGYLDRYSRPELRPPDARLVSFLRIAHPVVDRGPGDRGAAGVAPGAPGPGAPGPGAPAPGAPGREAGR